MPRVVLFLLFPLLLCQACDSSRIPGLWKTYQHPTYRFSLRLPRSWEIQRKGLTGADVVFLASEKDPIFRANFNVAVKPRQEEFELPRLMEISEKQLSFLLKGFETLSRAPSRLGDLPARELRARYQGMEGGRIIRVIVALSQDMEYVLTFSYREEKESSLLETFEKIRRSFVIQRNLSEG